MKRVFNINSDFIIYALLYLITFNVGLIFYTSIVLKINKEKESNKEKIVMFILNNIINGLILPILIINFVLFILSIFYLYIFTFKYTLNVSFLIFEFLFLVCIIFSIVLGILWYKFFVLIIKDVLKDKTLIDIDDAGFIVKISTAITLFLTAIQGIYNNDSKILPTFVVLISFITFLFSLIEIIMIYFNRYKKKI